MSNDVVNTKVDLTFADSVELMRNLPAYRFAYWFAIFITPLITFLSYLSLRKENEILAETPSQLTELNNEGAILMSISGLFFVVIIHFVMKAMPGALAKKFYKTQMNKGQTQLQVGFNKRKRTFFFGPNQKEYLSHAKLFVFSTSNNFLFYYGRSPRAVKFFLPKKGTEAHERSVKEIIEALRKEENVSIVEK